MKALNMKNPRQKLAQVLQKKVSQKGAVLLEALIAILIFSMGILAIAGLQTAMSKNTTEANYRSVAAQIVQKELSELMVNPTAARAKDIPVAELPNGNLVMTQPATGRVNFLVVWQVPGKDARQYVANASINYTN
jgi:type IV pilus assembly protein PilV